MDAFSRDVLHIYRVIVAFSIKAWHLADGAFMHRLQSDSNVQTKHL